MKIHIPNSVWLGNIDPFLDGFDPTDSHELTITTHQKWMSMHPVVLSMIAALGVNLEPSQIHFGNLQAKSKHYLERMKLFDFLGIESGIHITAHESTGRFIPLTQIQTADQLSHFIIEVTPLLHLEPHHAEPIRYIMSELIRNVLEHSGSKNGAIVCAQYYPKSNTIRIGIADTGVGMWRTIHESHNPINDLDAIRLALTPGITGTTSKEGGTEYNAGAGLFFIKSIATVNKDFFMIYSGRAMYKLLKQKGKRTQLHADPFDDSHSQRNDLPKWNGVVVGIDISLDATHEFAVLLQLMNETYSTAIKARKKSRYKKPQFI
jgi:anti-sigma regulatory factor (Ser/Thr protein kinase)